MTETKEKLARISKVDYHNFTGINTSIAERRRLWIGDYYINAAKCLKCGETIRSKNRHDYVTCKCGKLSVDGGSWYLRRAGDSKNFEDKSVLFNDIEKEKGE